MAEELTTCEASEIQTIFDRLKRKRDIVAQAWKGLYGHDDAESYNAALAEYQRIYRAVYGREDVVVKPRPLPPACVAMAEETGDEA